MLLSDNDETRKLFEQCLMKGKTVVNPIIDWQDTDIWEYIESEHICTNCLYKEGYDRVGCIGCPMAGKKRYKEFADFPKYKQAYISAFDRMLEVGNAKGKDYRDWKTGLDVFHWWMEEDIIQGQMTLEDFI